ncbi:Sialin [Hypsibius exemplaris]|uniref:Sialin n=1 Tax=Hypsibius exemplaris TaxID=2072580 RepID=A0A1W0WH34_HYPEX|nr:Sialin [Hypsibius exemplaris]
METGHWEISSQLADEVRPKTPWISSRSMFCVLSFLGFFNAYSLRVNLSVAIVAMVNVTVAPSDAGNTTAIDVCPSGNSTPSHSPTNNGGFDWDSNIQGVILGSFFYGYICTQFFGGWVSQRYGAKHPFGYAVLVSGALALLIPVAAKWHYGALIAVRVLQGLFQGVCYPSMHTMMGKWAPPLERSRMVSFTYAGSQIGTVASLLLSGVLAEHLGWESVFYFFGTSSILWYIFWLCFAFDSPNNHPRITEDERLYIIHAIGARSEVEEAPLPWRGFFTSLPVWALCVANFGHNWGFYTLLTNIPTYLSKILHFSLETNGFFSALPYLVSAIIMIVSGFAADSLRERRILSTTSVRRVFQFVGQLLPSVCLVMLGYIGCNLYVAVTLLTLAVGLDGITAAGYQVNHVDISPSHAGILLGISNTFGTIPGMVGPYVVGQLTKDPLGETIPQWRLVFFISAAIYMVTAIFFGVFASGELAAWETPRGKTTADDRAEEDDERLLTDHDLY